MSVTLQSASGRTLTVRVHKARTDSAATRAAIAIANREHGSQGWMALYVL